MKVKKTLSQLLRFGMVGALNTAVDAAVYAAAITVFGFSVELSQFLSYFIATLNSYFFNSRWTFREKSCTKSLIRFFVLNAVTLTLSIFLINFYKDFMRFGTIFGISVSETGNKLILKIPMMFSTTLINFFGSKLWVFKE